MKFKVGDIVVFKNWKELARDIGSKDNNLKDWVVLNHTRRFTIVHIEDKSIGSDHSFECILATCSEDGAIQMFPSKSPGIIYGNEIELIESEWDN